MNFISRIFSTATIQQIDPGQVQDRMTQTPRPFLLDVRQPIEYREGHISGAELISLDELPGKISRLPKDRELICICQSGSRSSAAARQLNAAGYTTLNLRGGMTAWRRAGLPVKKGMGR